MIAVGSGLGFHVAACKRGLFTHQHSIVLGKPTFSTQSANSCHSFASTEPGGNSPPRLACYEGLQTALQGVQDDFVIDTSGQLRIGGGVRFPAPAHQDQALNISYERSIYSYRQQQRVPAMDFLRYFKRFFHGKIQSQLRLRRFHQPLSSLLENQIQSRQAWVLIMRSSCVELVG